MLAQITSAFLLASASLHAFASPVVVDSSPVTLPFARRFKENGVANILANDQARAKSIKDRVTSKPLTSKPELAKRAAAFGIPSTNTVVEYLVEIQVGNPPVPYNVLVDTGSSNTWICCETTYAYSETSYDTGQSLYVEYGNAVVAGEQFLDQVTLTKGFTITNQSIGVALVAAGFNSETTGILGIGPADLNYNTLYPDATDLIPTVTDSGFSQGLIEANTIGIYFEPTASNKNVTNGEITFGSVDAKKYTGKLSYVPITETYPSTLYIGIDQNITYGTGKNAKIVMETTSGITDTGTTLLLMASDALANYTAATGATVDPNVGLLRLTPAQFGKLQSLFFTIGDETYEFTPNAQIWPRALNSVIGGDANGIYLIISDIGYDSGVGLDFINGMTWLERFYTVFDNENGRFGIANTKSTKATVN